MTQTGHDLSCIGDGLSWNGIGSFLRNVGADSATARELRPDLAEWATRAKTNALLADLYDLLSVMNANIVGIGSGRRPKRPKFYPRPGDRKDEKRYGHNPLPKDELRAWIEEKRRQRHG